MKELGPRQPEVKLSPDKGNGQSRRVIFPVPAPYQSPLDIVPIRVSNHTDLPRADRRGQTHLQRYKMKERGRQDRERVPGVVLDRLSGRSTIGKITTIFKA